MLKNLRVRTKLIAVLAVPLAALIVMAAIGVLDRRAEASEAREGRYLAELTAARVELVHQLQLERTWTAAAVSGTRTFGVEQTSAQRTITDTAVDRFLDDAQPARGVNDALAQQIDRVSADLEQLDGVRQSIDAGQVNPQVAVAYYSRVVLGLTELAAVTANAARGTDLQADLSSLVALSEMKEAQAGINATIAQMLVDGQGRDPQLDAIANGQAKLAEQQERFLDLASDAARREIQTLETASGSQDSLNMLRQITNAGANVPLSVPAADWVVASGNRLEMLRTVEDSITTEIATQASTIEDAATAAARNFLFGAVGVVLLSLLLASLVARSIARPLSRLTEGAYRLSEERLPALVEQLRNPESEHVGDDLQAIDIDSRDEIGQLAKAFNSIQDVTKNVATEQATLLRKGIGDIFVNLARRNQTLLDRQIEFIDQLESREEDPDQLENLFKLDHLATRMRRNAESLLVLAGAEAPRRRGRSVDMADVVRVAIGEVEHFARITLLALDEATVSATVAVDLAHLLSELMENATQFSPPETQVEIVGHKTRDGNYVLSVSDQGIGMTAEQLADANRLMANPPVVGLALSRSLGFIVIGRLAARFGLVVRLTGSPSGGVSALVTLPTSLIDTEIAVETPTVPSDLSSLDLTPPAIETPARPLDTSLFIEPPFHPTRPDAPAEIAATSTDQALEPPVDEPANDVTVAEATVADATVADAAPVAGSLPPPPAPPASPAPAAAAPLDLRPIVPPEGTGTLFEQPVARADSGPPAPPSSPSSGTLPAPPTPAVNGTGPSSTLPPLPTRTRVTPPAPLPTEAGPPAVAPSVPSSQLAPPPLPTRRAQPVTPDAPGPVTAGGLTRRVPKPQEPTAGNGRTGSLTTASATQRTPEEVRQMLSRYRSGLRRGRLDDEPETGQE